MCLFIYIYSHSITYNHNYNHNHHIFILFVTINCSIIIVKWNQTGCLYSFWTRSHIYAFSAVSVRHICLWDYFMVLSQVCELCNLQCFYVLERIWIKWHGQSSYLLPRGRSQRRGVEGVEMYLKETGCKGMGWINLAWDMDKWLSVWIQKWTIWFHTLWGIYWLAYDVLASEEGLCSTLLVGYLLNSLTEMSSEG